MTELSGRMLVCILDMQTLCSNWEAVETNGNKRNGGSFVDSACGVQRGVPSCDKHSHQPRVGVARQRLILEKTGDPQRPLHSL